MVGIGADGCATVGPAGCGDTVTHTALTSARHGERGQMVSLSAARS